MPKQRAKKTNQLKNDLSILKIQVKEIRAEMITKEDVRELRNEMLTNFDHIVHVLHAIQTDMAASRGAQQRFFERIENHEQRIQVIEAKVH